MKIRGVGDRVSNLEPMQSYTGHPIAVGTVGTIKEVTWKDNKIWEVRVFFDNGLTGLTVNYDVLTLEASMLSVLNERLGNGISS